MIQQFLFKFNFQNDSRRNYILNTYYLLGSLVDAVEIKRHVKYASDSWEFAIQLGEETSSMCKKEQPNKATHNTLPND